MKQANNRTKTISEECNNHMKNVYLPWFNFEKTCNSSTLIEWKRASLLVQTLSILVISTLLSCKIYQEISEKELFFRVLIIPAS